MSDKKKSKPTPVFCLSRDEAAALTRLLSDYGQLVRTRVIENIAKHGVVNGLRLNTNVHMEPAATCEGLLRRLDVEGFSR